MVANYPKSCKKSSIQSFTSFLTPDFDMSYAQQEHAIAVEHLAPRLAAVRNELCPGYISESYFWKIYFVLLHPRLDKHDAELLSTPQVCLLLNYSSKDVLCWSQLMWTCCSFIL